MSQRIALANSGTVRLMNDMGDEFFRPMGELPIRAFPADRVVVGVPQASPGSVALAIGNRDQDNYYILECEPSRARRIAACLLNKADLVEGVF